MMSFEKKSNKDGFELFRTDSNCMGDPQITLLESLLENNLTEFSDVLSDGQTDVNECYPTPHNKTCLDIACENGQTPFVELLLHHGAKVNQHNRVHRCKPIHFAANNGNNEVLRLLLKHGADVNSQNHHGRTALHLLAYRSSPSCSPQGEDKLTWSKRFQDCLQLLLEQDEINKEVKDNKGNTPLQLAILGDSREAAKILLSRGANGSTALELLRKTMPDLEVLATPTGKSDLNQNSQMEADTPLTLFEALKKTNLDEFKKCLTRNANLESFDGNKTPLQYACSEGLKDFVQLLLEAGAEVNSENFNSHMYPLHYAAERGEADIVNLLIKGGANPNVQDQRKDTPLHKAVRLDSRYYTDLEAYEKCVDALLSSPHIDVNMTDMFGNTPLHLAVINFPQNVTMKLLKKGADMGIRNQFDETPIARILPETLEKFLNECIEIVDNVETTNDNFGIDFNYYFLSPPSPVFTDLQKESFVPEIEESKRPETISLWYISRLKTHNHLLKHPVISSFLHFKWEKMRVFYYVNAFLYLLFLGLVTSCLLLSMNEQSESREQSEEPESTQDQSDTAKTSVTIMWYFILIFNIFFTLCELFQIMVSPCRYFWTFENWLEWGVIILLFYIYNNPESQNIRSLQALVILFVWGEMIMIMGRHPSSSTYINMFLTVSLSFIKFIAWYSILITAFALSFYIIFNPSDGFQSMGGTFMKSFVMMTGEFDFGDIPFDNAPHYSHIIFLGFVFFITMVLMNLLTGLAVSDTQTIREKAEILGYINQVDHLSYIECMLLGDPTKFLTNYPPFSWIPKCAPCNIMSRISPVMKFINFLGKSTLILSKEKKEKVTIYPNKKRSRELHITDNIVKSAIKVAKEGKDSLGILEASDRVKAMELKLASMENVIHAVSRDIEKLLTIMTTQNS